MISWTPVGRSPMYGKRPCVFVAERYIGKLSAGYRFGMHLTLQSERLLPPLSDSFIILLRRRTYSSFAGGVRFSRPGQKEQTLGFALTLETAKSLGRLALSGARITQRFAK